jgi:O-antigen/teichoic acid export membrane protein
MMSDLAKKARTAVAWTAGLNILRDVVQFVQMIIVVRLLPPEAYGKYGLSNNIIGFMMVFSAREFIAHTVLERDDEAVNYQEQFTAGSVIHGALFLIANAVAFSLRWFPSYAPVAPLLHLSSVLFLLDLPSELRIRMLERRMDWRRLRTVEGTGILLGAACTIVLAYAGAGAYALVFPLFLIPGAFATDLLIGERWRPTFQWSHERYRASRAFGTRRIVSLSIVVGTTLFESSVMARSVGFAVLGLFGRATGMATLFCQRISSLLTAAIYPVLARIPRRSDAYRRVSALVLRTVAWMVVPIAVGLSLVRQDVVTVMYGSRWLEVIPLVPLAMSGGVVLAIGAASYSLLLASQEARLCLYADAWRLIAMPATVLIAIPLGLQAYLLGLVAVHLVSTILTLNWLRQTGGISIGGIVSAIVPPFAASAVAVLTAESARVLALAPMPPFLRLAIYIPVFAATYLVVLRTAFSAPLREVIGYLPKANHVHRLLGFAEAA